MDHAVHHGHGPDAKAQREDRDGREATIAGQLPDAVAQVLPQRVENAGAVHGVDLLADPRPVAELAPRRVVRLVRRHPARDVLVRLVLEVRLELARPLLVPVAAAKEADAGPSLPQSDAGRSTRLTAATISAQRPVCEVSWRRPFGVSR